MMSFDQNDEKYDQKLKFRWSRVTDQFESIRSSLVDKKIHFDNVPDSMRLIDGAKEKWSDLLILDAIISIIREDQKLGTPRRKFNQQRVLTECIYAELSFMEGSPRHNNTSSELENLSPKGASFSQHNSSDYLDGENTIPLFDVVLESPWTSLDRLCEVHALNTPSKAKQKYLDVLEFLTSHDALSLHDYGIKSIIMMVITEATSGNKVSPTLRKTTKILAPPLPFSNNFLLAENNTSLSNSLPFWQQLQIDTNVVIPQNLTTGSNPSTTANTPRTPQGLKHKLSSKYMLATDTQFIAESKSSSSSRSNDSGKINKFIRKKTIDLDAIIRAANNSTTSTNNSNNNNNDSNITLVPVYENPFESNSSVSNMNINPFDVFQHESEQGENCYQNYVQNNFISSSSSFQNNNTTYDNIQPPQTPQKQNERQDSGDILLDGLFHVDMQLFEDMSVSELDKLFS